MSGHTYLSFVGLAVLLVLLPGPDFAVVTRNTLAGGRRRGTWSALGVTTSNAVQGVVAALGLGALIVRAEPVFETIRWAGVAYLALLAAQSLRAAVRGRDDEDATGRTPSGVALAGFRQGFLSNITNPKVLVFYLAVLPQFLHGSAGAAQAVLLALTHAVLSLLWLLIVVTGLDRVGALVRRRRVRRAMDGVTGLALLGFGARLAVEG